jgi:hypothetical protein
MKNNESEEKSLALLPNSKPVALLPSPPNRGAQKKHDSDIHKILQYSHGKNTFLRFSIFKKLLDKYQYDFENASRSKIKQFLEIKSIPPSLKKEIHQEVIQSIGIVQGFESWSALTEEIAEYILGIVITIPLLLFGISVSWYSSNQNYFNTLTIILFAVGVFIILLVVWFGWLKLYLAIIPSESDSEPAKVWYQALLVISVFLIGIFLFTSFKIETSTIGAPQIVVISSLVDLSLIFLIISANIFSVGYVSFSINSKSRYLTFLSILSLLGVGLMGASSQFGWHQALKIGLTLGVMLQVSFLFLELLTELIIFFLKRRLTSRYPNEEIVHKIFTILVSSDLHSWKGLGAKKEILFSLNQLSMMLEINLYQSLNYGLGTKKWLKRQVAEVSSYVNTLKRKVVMSDENTQNEIISYLSTHLVDAAKGNWGKFERENAVNRIEWPLVFSKLQDIFVSVISFSIVVILYSVPNNLDPSTKTSVTSSLIILGITNFLSIFDSNIDKKISMLKNFQEILKK